MENPVFVALVLELGVSSRERVHQPWNYPSLGLHKRFIRNELHGKQDCPCMPAKRHP